MNADSRAVGERPEWVLELEQVFGGPSQAAFGTAVFFETLPASGVEPVRGSLEQRALAWYKFFCGKTWERFGSQNWLETWRVVFTRTEESSSIIDALTNLEDHLARSSGTMMLDGNDDPQRTRQALSQAFDTPATAELQVYGIGDGGAMTGILIAGRRTAGESAFVTFLLD